MKAASSNEIKQELKTLTPAQLIELCLKLARFKKENKELLTYLLFEANDLDGYIKNVKQEISEGFVGINTSNLYYAKKGLRKVLRSANKYIRYAGNKQAEVELLIHFSEMLKESGIRIKKSNALIKLYSNQLKKINAAVEMLHEDLKHDYLKSIKKLEEETF